MERKTVNTILTDEFEEFLKINQLYTKFINNELFCFYCKKPITIENISSIFYEDGPQFCCDEMECINQISKRK
jgi:hypothetical protein